MGCGCGKAQAGQVHNAVGKKESLPPTLAAASRGRFQTALPLSVEGRRDFARIFFADQRKIYILAGGMPSMRPLQPTAGPSSAHIGDLNAQVVERAEGLFTERLTEQISQVSGKAADPAVVEALRSRAMAGMTVNVGVDFALHMKLLPTFLQPFFLIILLADMKEARAATYGFVASRPDHISGKQPEDKRTPFCVRLLSPNLLSSTEDDDKNWEVEYKVWEARASSIKQAVEMDLPTVREAISASRWDPLLAGVG